MKFERFEDIKAWQEARELVKLVYRAIKTSKDFRSDYRLVSQIQAAAVSTMANIAEGFARHSNKEFVQFLFISKSSAAEVQSHLYVALDQEYIDKEIFTPIYRSAETVSRMNSNLIKYLKERQKPAHTSRTQQGKSS
jgi:four helix bundle protein